MPPISIELALLAGRAVFLVFCFIFAAIAFTRWRRAADRSTAQFGEQTAAVLERLAALEGRLEATQASCSEISEKLANAGTSATGTVATPSYQIAIRLARSGATREEMMASCGVTRQEAELMQRLHAPPPQPRLVAAG